MKRVTVFTTCFAALAVTPLFAAELLQGRKAESASGVRFQKQEPDYFVSKTGCSNSGPGSAAQPFCSVQMGIDKLRAGDTLLIRNGKYRERVVSERSGTAEAPIVIRGESRDKMILDGGCKRFPCSESRFPGSDGDADGLVVQGHDYVTVQDLTVQNTLTNGIYAINTTGLTLANLVVKRTGMSGINIYDSKGPTVQKNRVTRSNLGIRDTDGEVDSPEESITIVNTSDFDVSYNHLHDSLKEGIDIKVRSRNGTVHHNLVSRICAVGIYLNEAFDVNVYRNRIFKSGSFKTGGRVRRCSSIPRYGKNYGKYFGTGLQLAVGDLGRYGKGKLSNIHVYENVISGANLNCLGFWDELRENKKGRGKMTDNRVFNNVFYGCGRGSLGSGIRMEDATNTTVANNIIARNKEAGITGNSVKRATVSNNLFYKTGESAGADKIIGDPRLVGAEKGNFHVQKDSPAIDRGIDIGLAFVGDAPDIGAYEYGSND